MSDPGWDDHCGDRWRAHVLAATGVDICDIVGPSPRSAREWAALMRRLGVRSMDGVVSAVHGEPIPTRQARRGDIVRRGWALGVCRGDLAEFYGRHTIRMEIVDNTWCFKTLGEARQFCTPPVASKVCHPHHHSSV